MKRFIFGIAGATLLSLAISCQKTEKEETASNDGIPDAVKAKISALGLTATGAYKTDGGYIAEGDIFLDDAILNSSPEQKFLVVANNEQYRTTNLVAGSPRFLTIRYTGAQASVSAALNNAIARYNALPATYGLRFTRVAAGAAALITVSDIAGQPYIAAAGFPAGGQPFNSIRFNTAYAGLAGVTLTTVLAHEMGHCIGFRHTDWACRQFSCGGAAVNEGAAPVGAIHIPGTPVACNGDPTSWMLACVNFNGQDRPFNANDRVALDFLY
ncbi:MAG: protease [Dinghuibacter sp.]|nr:protease [Dinghuibacter sp.]